MYIPLEAIQSYKSGGGRRKRNSLPGPESPTLFRHSFQVNCKGIKRGKPEAPGRPALPLGFGFLLCPPSRRKAQKEEKEVPSVLGGGTGHEAHVTGVYAEGQRWTSAGPRKHCC